MQNSITLWGRKNSGNVQKVLFLLDELGLEYEHLMADLGFGQMGTPEVRALNPNALVPILQHGDVTIWESHAILRYLAATFGGAAHWPASSADRVSMDQWMEWSQTTLIPSMVRLFLLIVRTAPSKQDPQLIAEASANAARVVKILDSQLAKTNYVAGDNFSIADITCASFMYRWTTMDIERPDVPNLTRWLKLLQERPAYRKWSMVSYEEMKVRDA